MAAETGREVPCHVAIIMDGNGRWAKARGLERLEGHMQGVESIRRAVKGALTRGVRYLTLYAFSTENWGRPRTEVSGLMDIFCRCAVNETPELKRQGVRLRFIGDVARMSGEVREGVAYCERETAENDRLTVLVALNYSARWEITQAVRTIAGEVREGKLLPEEIASETVSSHLTTVGVPDPDLLIRTSGEYRISNFLLWQSAYAEFYFTDICWPDFDEAEFDRALAAYAGRNRRFGRV